MASVRERTKCKRRASPTPLERVAPEVFLAQSPTLFDEEDRLNEGTAHFLQDYVDRFVGMIARQFEARGNG